MTTHHYSIQISINYITTIYHMPAMCLEFHIRLDFVYREMILTTRLRFITGNLRENL